MLKFVITALWAALICGPVFAQVKAPVDHGAAKRPQPSEAARKIRQAKDDSEAYKLELTVLATQGANRLNSSRHTARVNVIYTDGFFISMVLKSHADGKLMGVGRSVRTWKDVREVPISRVEVVYSKEFGSDGDRWDLYDIEVRSLAYSAADARQQKQWMERDFFGRMRTLKPGDVATSVVKQPMMDPLPWVSGDHFVSNMQVQMMIGADDVKTNYRALNLAMTIKSQPGVVYRYSIAGDGEERRLLTGGRTLFRLDEAQWRRVSRGTWLFTNDQGAGPPASTRFSDIEKLWLEYEFGDHGPLENDDWDLQGLSINWGGATGYGYRFFTDWNARKRMTRSSRFDIVN